MKNIKLGYKPLDDWLDNPDHVLWAIIAGVCMIGVLALVAAMIPQPTHLP